jgi:hypothetical protein
MESFAAAARVQTQRDGLLKMSCKTSCRSITCGAPAPGYVADFARPQARLADPEKPGAGQHSNTIVTKDSYSITSLTRFKNDCGTASPRVLAVFPLMISSTFVDSSNGMSPGFSPLRILATNAPAWRKPSA